ncbi:MAG: hypothetical protein KJZ65_06890 [Phycisphaerales bacterium]|nr:hypothetical protein [Phycisphaerales bacterium]
MLDPLKTSGEYPLWAGSGAEAVVEGIAGSIHATERVDAATLNSFRGVVRDVMTAYLSEHLAEFNGYLESMGVEPIGKGESGDSEQWLAFRRCFADARFDPASAKVMHRISRGAALSDANADSMRMSERPEARPGWARSPSESYELRVKGLFRAYAADSPQFEATLGIEFAHNPGTQEWVLIRTRLYDVPDGVMVVDPPV